MADGNKAFPIRYATYQAIADALKELQRSVLTSAKAGASGNTSVAVNGGEVTVIASGLPVIGVGDDYKLLTAVGGHARWV